MSKKETVFDNPAYVWVVTYFDREQDHGDTNKINDVMSVFEYHEKPLTKEEVLEEVRSSFTAFLPTTDKNKTLKELGISIVSVEREEC